MPESSPTRTDPVQRAIRADILTGVHAPGEPLRIAALAERYDVSYSVVREALLRLEGQGLTRAVPQKGFHVTPASRRDLEELTQLRRLVEGQAFRESIAAGDLAWESLVISAMHLLARLSAEDTTALGTSEEWVAAHAAFHQALVSACPNGRLRELSTQLRDTAEIYRQLSQAPASGAASSCSHDAAQGTSRRLLEEHQQLADLAVERRADEGVAALEQHLQTTTDLTLARHFHVPVDDGPVHDGPAQD